MYIKCFKANVSKQSPWLHSCTDSNWLGDEVRQTTWSIPERPAFWIIFSDSTYYCSYHTNFRTVSTLVQKPKSATCLRESVSIEQCFARLVKELTLSPTVQETNHDQARNVTLTQNINENVYCIFNWPLCILLPGYRDGLIAVKQSVSQCF